MPNCLASYGAYQEKTLRLHLEKGGIAMPEYFSYRNHRLPVNRREGQAPARDERIIYPRNQFSLEIDHFAESIRENKQPHTPGKEGLQDQLITEAIYRLAAEHRPVALEQPPTSTREPMPAAEG